MILEIRGTSVRNKGAELMLRAIIDHYGGMNGNVQFVVDPWFGPFADRARYGLRSKLRSSGLGRTRLAVELMSDGFRHNYGLVLDREIDAVLDASGFAFGDQCGLSPTQDLADAARRWHDSGKKVVMLPQALGPFSTPELKSAFAQVIENVDRVYARDPQSFTHTQSVSDPGGKLRLAPDFTNLVSGVAPAEFAASTARACIVPNYRMVDKTSPDESKKYVPFLASCVRSLKRLGLEPFVLLHDAHVDKKLVDPLCKAVDDSLEVVSDADPVRLKGILGSSLLVVGSRYHALVGALSQAVPSLACGWSHKYQTLFDDYGCGEMVLPVDAEESRIEASLAMLSDEGERGQRIARLRDAVEQQQRQTREMWRDVDELLGLASKVYGGANRN